MTQILIFYGAVSLLLLLVEFTMSYKHANTIFGIPGQEVGNRKSYLIPQLLLAIFWLPIIVGFWIILLFKK